MWIESDEEQPMLQNIDLLSTFSLQSLLISIPPSQTFAESFMDFAIACPNLEHFSLLFNYDSSPQMPMGLTTIASGVPEVAAALAVLLKLRTILLPVQWFAVKELHETLSQLSSLARLHFSLPGIVSRVTDLEEMSANVPPQPPPFNRLQEFRLPIFSDVQFPLFLSQTSYLTPSLVSLFIDLRGSADHAHTLSNVLQNHCNNLQWLVLASSEPFLSADTEATLDLTNSLFSGASHLRKLKVLEMHLEHPLAVSNHELEDAVRNWPDMQLLSLCPLPLAEALPDVHGFVHLPTLACLLFLSRHCPSLIHLGLYLDATTPYNSLPNQDPLTNEPYRLSASFKELNLTFSKLDEPNDVANYLNLHLPPDATLRLSQVNARSHMLPKLFTRTLVYGRTLRENTRLLKEKVARYNKWRKVKRLFNLLRGTPPQEVA